MNHKIIFSFFCVLTLVYAQQEKFTKEYIEENTVIHAGSVSQQAVTMKHFIVLFTVHKEQNNGAIASSWSDFEEVGFDLASFEKDMGVDFSETYAFVQAENIGGQAPIMLSRAPTVYKDDGSLGRYVIWLNGDSYYFSKVPESEIEALLSKYNVKFLNIDAPVVEATPTLPVSEVTEIAKEATAPEPITEEPAEVVFAEATEEPVEKSSNWWLWLVGLVVVVGGVVAVRRKS